MQQKSLRLFVFLAACASTTLFGQTGLATLTGVVTDPAGAVVSGVTVTATQTETGTTVSANTSETGLYTIPSLRVGEYNVSIEQAGFKAVHRNGISLVQAQTLRLDIQLEVGAATETVTVTGEAPLLHNDSGTMVANINIAQLRSLPLLPVGTFIRDPFAMSNTVAGINQTFVGTRVNGLGQSTIQYRLDGEVLGQVGFPGITTRTQPSPDAIEEVAVQTTNIPVEFGAVSGAVFNVSIKSGTNQFHGTVYDYAVNEVLNAYDPANHVRNRVRRHDYGFNIGGPVDIPGVYDGHNKSFFFFNWEQYRDSQKAYAASLPTVPTQAYRDGDFSGLFGASGNANLRLASGDYVDPLGNKIALGTIFDPTTTHTVTCNAAVTSNCTPGASINVRTAFPGNKIPATMFDPVSVAVLNKYVPLPTNPNSLINNYQVPIPTSRITSSPALKADHNFTSKLRMSFTYSQNKTTSAVQTLGGLAEGFNNAASGNTGTYEAGPQFRLNTDYTITPTMNYHLGLGYSMYSFETKPLITDYNALQDIGLRGATANKNFPRFNLGGQNTPATGGLNNLGTGGQTGNFERRPSITETLTWIRGNHTIKLGNDFRQDMLPNFGYAGANGNYSFANAQGQGATWDPALLNLTGFQGNSNVGFTFANFLMGAATNATLSTPINYRRSKQQWGVFIQDTWRARRNLTIDYGIRWDYGTYTREDYGRLGAFSPTALNSSAANHPGGLIYEATCQCNFASNYPYAIGPRLGAAYTIDQKTVIRGGIGLAYGSTPIVSGVAQNSATTPALTAGDVSFYLKDGIPSSVAPVWPNYSTGQGLPVGGVAGAPTYIDPNAGRPDRTLQYNVSIQREITRNFVAEVSYVGNRGAWQSTAGFQDQNAISVQTLAQYGFTVGNLADKALLQSTVALANKSALAAHGVFLPYSNFPSNQTVLQSLKPYPQYSSALSPAAPMGRSWYDSLQVNLNKRYSHGLQLTANYTYSKNLQYTSSFDVFNRANGKDINTANQPNVLRVTFAYQTPRIAEAIPVLGNKWVSWGMKDWQISAAMFYQTGAYLGRPTSAGANPVSQWLGRPNTVGAQLKQNADGSYMNPWSVDWYDNSGKHHTDPLDINCHCFDPNKTQVLNPAAWSNVPDGFWGAQTQQLPFFRAARRPNESANLARNFRMGPEGRYTLQVRVEFQNIFNRLSLPAPTLGNYTTPNGKSADGRNINGFGSFGNLYNAGAYGVNGAGTQRSGQFIARFTF